MTKEEIQIVRKEFETKIEVVKKEFNSQMKKILLEMSKKVFNKYPSLNSFGWRQGTYYNDENHVFGVHNDSYSITLNEQHCDDYEHDTSEIDKDIEKYSNNPEIKKLLKKQRDQIIDKGQEKGIEIASFVSDILNGLSNKDYEIMFGDSVEVTVKKDGNISIEQFTGY